MNVQDGPLPVVARYTRSVHIARDFDTIDRSLADYQITPLVLQTLERILAGVQQESTTRAFSLVGVYGTGKSSFGLFLAHYLSSEPAGRKQILASLSPAEIEAQSLALRCPAVVSRHCEWQQ